MADEPEYRDANSQTVSLPNKGRAIIQFVAGGLVLGILTTVGYILKPIGLAIGGAAFFYGIFMLIRRRRFNFKNSLFITVCGFFMLIAYSRIGIFSLGAWVLLYTGSVVLIIAGIIKAINLAWEVGKLN